MRGCPDASRPRRRGRHRCSARTSAAQAILAAFAPVAGRGLGVVASTELERRREPLTEPAAIVGSISFTLIVASTVLFFAVGNPMLRRFREGEDRFRELFENMRSGATVYRAIGEADDFVITGFNRGAERIEGIVAAGRARPHLVRDVPGAAPEPAVRGDAAGLAHRPVGARAGDPLRGRPHRTAGARATSTGCPRARSSPSTTTSPSASGSEEALKESEARWRSIIEAHAQAIVIVDQQHEIRFVNKAAEDLFGHAAQDLIGAPFGFPLVQGDVAEIEIIRPGRSLAYRRDAGDPDALERSGQLPAVHPGRLGAQAGRRRSAQAVSGDRAEPGVGDDHRRRRPHRVRQSEVHRNHRLHLRRGRRQDAELPAVPATRRGREYEDLWKTISAGQVWRGEFNNRRKNGELFWELASIAPVRDGRGKVTHYVAVKEDISERKATEERLRQSQRMETIGQLTGGIAHDFNNLLAIILGNLQLAGREERLDRESRELIADAIWSAERGAQLTHRLLAFARRQRLNPKVDRPQRHRRRDGRTCCGGPWASASRSARSWRRGSGRR